MFRAGWAADYPDPHNFMNIFTCNGGNNETGWCSPSYDKNISLASYQTSRNKREETYFKAQKELIYDKNIIIPLFISNQIYLKNKKIKNVHFSKMGIIDFSEIELHPTN
jgi:oligopeptide transport system substrate-binding protein